MISSEVSIPCGAVPEVAKSNYSMAPDSEAELGMILKNDLKTHGYVHGHIHKHRDHTHIHGHIHNHDHRSHNKIETSNVNAGEDVCKKIDDYSICQDVLCDDLDDCFFLNCEDTRLSSFQVGCEDFSAEDGAVLEEDPSKILTSKTDVEHCHKHFGNDSLDSTSHLNVRLKQELDSQYVSSTNHENSLCTSQLSKKPIFENLITNVRKKVYPEEDVNIGKKRKITPSDDLDIHYPHQCHSNFDPSVQLKGMVEENSSIHQSCFHTTIPNLVDNPTSESQLMSDFDFFIQFDNFNQFINGLSEPAEQKPTAESMGSKLESPYTSANILPQTIEPQAYACKWDNCSKTISNNTLTDHIVNSHIDEEYNSFGPKNNRKFLCEWQECNYMGDSIHSLVDHLNSHMFEQTQVSPLQLQQSILSPASTGKSDFSSPEVYSVHDQREENAVSIRSLKISPKSKSCCDDAINDPYFTCHWHVGVDSDGNPIHCSKTHLSAGDLQNHLINDHIGSGKSVYSCNWIGCERHNGNNFTQRQKLLRHIHIHTKYKPCKCEICGSAFAVESMLKQHSRTHSGEKPFSCSICGKKFATSSSLSIHNRVHTGEKPLVCRWPGCNKRFSESSNLTKHMKIHLKTFKCNVCGLEFDKKPNYTKHIKIHEVESKGGK